MPADLGSILESKYTHLGLVLWKKNLTLKNLYSILLMTMTHIKALNVVLYIAELIMIDEKWFVLSLIRKNDEKERTSVNQRASGMTDKTQWLFINWITI